MGMFDAFEAMKAEIKAQRYQENVDKNNSADESDLSKMLRAVLVDDPNKKVVLFLVFGNDQMNGRHLFLK
jgi:hypothetical protein